MVRAKMVIVMRCTRNQENEQDEFDGMINFTLFSVLSFSGTGNVNNVT